MAHFVVLVGLLAAAPCAQADFWKLFFPSHEAHNEVTEEERRTGWELSSYVIDERTDLDALVADVTASVEQARANNPAFNDRPLIVTVVKRDGESTAPPVEVGAFVQSAVSDSNLLTIRASDELQKQFEQVTLNRYRFEARNGIDGYVTRLSLKRFFIVGSVMAVSIMIDNLPAGPSFGAAIASGMGEAEFWQAVRTGTATVVGGLLGGAAAGLVSRGLQRTAVEVNHFVDRNPIWDRHGNRVVGPWLVAREAWAVLKQAGYILGFMHIAHVVASSAMEVISGFNANPAMFSDYGAWEKMAIGGALFSAAFMGQWKKLESLVVMRSLRDNALYNYPNDREGIQNATGTLTSGQKISFLHSVTSSALEALSLVPSVAGFARGAMLVIGGSGKALHIFTTKNFARNLAQYAANYAWVAQTPVVRLGRSVANRCIAKFRR